MNFNMVLATGSYLFLVGYLAGLKQYHMMPIPIILLILSLSLLLFIKKRYSSRYIDIPEYLFDENIEHYICSRKNLPENFEFNKNKIIRTQSFRSFITDEWCDRFYLPSPPENINAVLLVGDFIPLQIDRDIKKSLRWLNTMFNTWLLDIIKVPVIVCGGNHDRVLDNNFTNNLPCIYLENSAYVFNGIKIWGSPNTNLFGWAFHKNESQLKEIWSFIPEDTDILMTHSPAYGIGDMLDTGEKIGSPSLTNRITKLRLHYHLFGHNHGGFGQYNLGETKCYNVSFLDDNYFPVDRSPFILEI